MQTIHPDKPTPLIVPYHFRVVRRYIKEGIWKFCRVKPFFNTEGMTKDLEGFYETTKKDVVTELFRINGGRQGWYLANLRDRKYYYCGLDREDVREKLREISG